MGGNDLASISERKLNDAIEDEFLSFQTRNEGNRKSSEQAGLPSGAIGAIAGATFGAKFGPLGIIFGGIIGALLESRNVTSEIKIPTQILQLKTRQK